MVNDVFGESHPGSVHLDKLTKEINTGIIENGGKPSNFHVTDICDGIAQGHNGMNYILLSREVIADMVEIHGHVHPWDGMVLVSSCDKSNDSIINCVFGSRCPTFSRISFNGIKIS